MSPTLLAPLLVFVALAVAAVPLTWMWLRLQRQRKTSLDDYVAQSKARAEAELRAMLKEDKPG